VVLDARRGLLKDGREAWGLRVSDQGIGMTESQLSRVFERFFRADPSGTILGTGLGMCLVKELIELQGGEVEVQSQIGQGTQVTLWLPLRLAPRSGDSRSLGLRADATNRP
jgi:signal transduction histidine kinase